MKLKVLLVDDNAFYRQGFNMMLERFDIVGEIYEAESGQDFINKVGNILPDIVFMDIKMPDMDGIEATRQATDNYREINIIALTMFGDEKYLHKMIEAGAKGYLLKDSAIDEILLAINTVMSGKNYYSSRVLDTQKYKA